MTTASTRAVPSTSKNDLQFLGCGSWLSCPNGPGSFVASRFERKQGLIFTHESCPHLYVCYIENLDMVRKCSKWFNFLCKPANFGPYILNHTHIAWCQSRSVTEIVSFFKILPKPQLNQWSFGIPVTRVMDNEKGMIF